MNLKIKCQTSDQKTVKDIRVKVLKAPFVNSSLLNQIIKDRKKAIILN